MTAEPAPLMVGPAGARSMPWRVITDSHRTAGMAVGDARLPPHTAGPNRKVHTREDEGVYVITGVLTAEGGDQRYEEVILAINARYGVYPADGPPLIQEPPPGQNPGDEGAPHA